MLHQVPPAFVEEILVDSSYRQNGKKPAQLLLRDLEPLDLHPDLAVVRDINAQRH